MAVHTESFDGSSLDLDWTAVRGSDPITLNGDGTATIDSTSNVYYRADHDVESPDMFAECEIASDAQDTEDGDPRSVLLLRAADGSAQTYYAAVLQLTGQVLTFLSWEDGDLVGGAPFGDVFDTPVTVPSAPFTWRFEVEGSEFRGYIDGELVKTETNSDRSTGSLGGFGVQRGETIDYGEFRTGSLEDDDEDPGGGDPEAPEIIGVYTDANSSTGGSASVTVPNVEDGDTLVAILGECYGEESVDPEVSDDYGGTSWTVLTERIGAGTDDPFENMNIASWHRQVDGPGEVTVTVSMSLSNEVVGVVYHLRNVDSIGETNTVAEAQGYSEEFVEVGGIGIDPAPALVIGAFGALEFGADPVFTAPSGMTEDVQELIGDFFAFMTASEVIDSISDTGSRSADVNGADAGASAILFAVNGTSSSEPEPEPTPEPGRFFLAM